MKLFLPLAGTFPYPEDATDVFETCQNALRAMEIRTATADEYRRMLGRRPYWFAFRRAPPYTDFVVGATDTEERQYMSLSPDRIGVRLPRGKRELELPQVGEILSIILKGTGTVVTVYVHGIELPRGTRPRTAILQVTYIEGVVY
jgi:hypothetical protein